MNKSRFIVSIVSFMIGILTYTNATIRTFTVTKIEKSSTHRYVVGWLSIPEQNSSVAIKVKVELSSKAFANAAPGSVYQQDDMNKKFTDNVLYISMNNTQGDLPKGLYYWKKDENTHLLRHTQSGNTYTLKNWNPKGQPLHPWEQKVTKPYQHPKKLKKLAYHSKKASRLFTNYKDILGDLTNLTEKDFVKLSQTQKNKFFSTFIEPNAGKYYEYELTDINLKTDTLKPLVNKGFFKVLYDTQVQEILGMDKFENSAIQTASTRYALEGGMEKPSSLLNDTQTHAVQGETGSVGLYYGFFARKYSLPIKDLLRGTLFRIGYQRDTKAAYEADMTKQKNSFHLLKKTSKSRNFDQVVSFAVNLNPKHLGFKPSQQEKNFAKHVLFATYDLSVRAAFLNGRKTLFLTLVGGGAFENDHQWIYDAIKNTLPFIVRKNMSVYLVIPDKQSTKNSWWKNLEDEYTKIKKPQNK
jgi:hypothetical protein